MVTAANRIVVKGVLKVRPGQLDDAKDAARDQRAKTLGKPGVVTYEFFADDATQRLLMIEIYEDSDAMLNHIATASFDRLLNLVDIELLEMFGDPSPVLETTLNGFESPLAVYRPLSD